MWQDIADYFSQTDFMPHGHCYLWKPDLVSVHVISDFLIGTEYVAISFTLYWLLKKINLSFNRVVLCFGVFIGACGWTHYNEIWNLWYSDYWYSGAVKILTAIASVGTGVYLWKLKHPILLVAEAAKLSEQRRLDLEVLTEDLEQRVFERTTALSRNESQLRLITNALPVLISYIDANERYLYANATYEKWFGFSPEEMIGKSIKEFVGEEQYDKLNPYIKAALSGEKLSYQSTLKSLSGEIIVDITYVPDIDENSNVRGYVALVEDVTEKKKADLERDSLVVRLQEAVIARDEFLSIASHELKTPLTTLFLHNQKMKRAATNGDETAYSKEQVDKLLDANDKNLKRLSRLIEDMLDIERIKTGLSIQPEQFDLCDLISEVTEVMGQHFSKAGVNVKIVQCENAVGRWDKFRIEQVLANLFLNVVKYASGKPVEIKVTKDSHFVIVSVKDQGPGIPADAQKRIFAKFERAISANEVSGLGLGLYISSEIINAHQGTMWVESRPSNGSIFYFKLPLLT